MIAKRRTNGSNSTIHGTKSYWQPLSYKISANLQIAKQQELRYNASASMQIPRYTGDKAKYKLSCCATPTNVDKYRIRLHTST
jgi:hypothetical protein